MTDSDNQFEELRAALAHLNDPAFLEAHALVGQMRLETSDTELTRGQLLRRTLRLAIEALDPGPQVAPNAPEARPYHVLRGRYIAGQTIQDVAEQLDISERQAYRELRRGVEGVAGILDAATESDKGADCSFAHDVPPSAAGVIAEVARLSTTEFQIVDLIRLLDYVVACVQPLAQDHEVTVRWQPSAEALYVSTHRIMLRQAILNLLSALVRLGDGSDLAVQVWPAGDRAVVRIIGPADLLAKNSDANEPYAIANQLLDILGLAPEPDDMDASWGHITIRIPLAQERLVLIIDDNPGLVRLFERYLEGRPYLVRGITDSTAAEAAVQQMAPDIIIMDVMMPGMDGWEVLQMLRRSDQGRRARVIICSIINDPELAASLGADGFLPKPVDRVSLLQALSSVSEGEPSGI